MQIVRLLLIRSDASWKTLSGTIKWNRLVWNGIKIEIKIKIRVGR